MGGEEEVGAPLGKGAEEEVAEVLEDFDHDLLFFTGTH